MVGMKLRLNDVSVSFGENTVLSHINFEVNDHDKVAVVGRNGCGKTTLLKVLMGEQEIDTMQDSKKINRIEKTGTFKVGHLKQIAFKDDQVTLEDEVITAYQHILDLKAQMKQLEELCATSPEPAVFDKYSRICEEFDRIGGYTFTKEMNQSLKQFGFTEKDKKKKLCEFSGGQRTKIALIKLLLSKPDLLILDEPTNHLDINAIEWLENYLLEYKKAVVVVSHDRAFLDKFVNVVYEIERHKITKYIGNYTKFAENKKRDYQRKLKEYSDYTEEVNRLQTLADRFRYKATKASMAQSKLKAIDRMEEVENPESADVRAFHANIKPELESGTSVIRAEELQIGYEKTLSTVNLRLNKGDRVGIIGGNGLGKSTFLKTIMARVEPRGGKIVFGTNVTIGYFDQQTATNNISDQTILDNYTKEFPELTTTEARTDLGSFMFSQDDVFKNLRDLSGGELVRLELCKIFKRKPNTLILDEPTNHLDIVGKEALEDLLSTYTGTILFVSHDRYFVKKLAESLLVFENGVSTYYPNTTYAEYTNKLKSNNTEVNVTQLIEDINYEPPEEDEEAPEEVKVNTYLKSKEDAKRRAKLKKIEREITELEQKVKDLTQEYQNPEICSDFVKLYQIETDIANAEQKIEELTETWFEENALLEENNN